MADVKRKTALVTGAGRGIGRATVLYLAERGVDVAVHDLDPETAAATAADCARLGVGAERGGGGIRKIDLVGGLAIIDAVAQLRAGRGSGLWHGGAPRPVGANQAAAV